jgi:UDP-N-acetylglucosamine 1-carboxyvinyltransferase
MRFLVKGGRPLNGEIKLAGSKNAATKMMIASLLTDEGVTLVNFPKIGDTEITAELLRNIGSEVTTKRGVATLKTSSIKNSRVTQLSRKNRIPILALGPLLARAGEAEVPILGGDKIGPRPVNLHIKALEALGATIETTSTSYHATAKNGLHGARVELDFPSVGATENTILAAVLAKGNTTILNAALEPEVMGVVKMLQKMGAIIELGANRDIHIEGVKRLRGVEHKILPDRIEAVSFACLAIATSGKVLVKDAAQDHLITFLNTVRRMGAEYEVIKEGIIFHRANGLRALHIETGVHPGFMTDWQQPLAVLLTQAEGDSVIHETIYEDRFGYVKDLNAIGANIEVSEKCPETEACRFAAKGRSHVAVIHGPTKLQGGGKFEVRDLRSGMVDVIAALVADGESEITGIEEIDRGYENIDERLKKLGADIKRRK